MLAIFSETDRESIKDFLKTILIFIEFDDDEDNLFTPDDEIETEQESPINSIENIEPEEEEEAIPEQPPPVQPTDTDEDNDEEEEEL